MAQKPAENALWTLAAPVAEPCVELATIVAYKAIPVADPEALPAWLVRATVCSKPEVSDDPEATHVNGVQLTSDDGPVPSPDPIADPTC